MESNQISDLCGKSAPPVFQHPRDEVGLLLHNLEVLGRAGVEVADGEAEGVGLHLRVATRLALDGHHTGRHLGY